MEKKKKIKDVFHCECRVKHGLWVVNCLPTPSRPKVKHVFSKRYTELMGQVLLGTSQPLLHLILKAPCKMGTTVIVP